MEIRLLPFLKGEDMIIKSKHASNYTVLPNSIFKKGLSIEAIGMISYLLSLPHNWILYKTTIHRQLNLGRDKCRNIIKELETHRYIISEMRKNKGGKIYYDHVVYDIPPKKGKPLTDLPSTVEPSTDLPLTANKKLISKHSNKETLTKETTNNTSFISFWELYDKKVGNIDIVAGKWDGLSITDRNLVMAYIPKYIKAQPEKKFRKNPSTFLNQRGWEDELINYNNEKSSWRSKK